MPDNLRHAQYGDTGGQIDDPQSLVDLSSLTRYNLRNIATGTPVGQLAVSLGSFSQSVPFGACLSSPDLSGTKQRVLFSAINQGYIEGDVGNLTRAQHGSPITLLIQKLAPYVRIFHHNGGLGSISMTNDALGVLDVTGAAGWRGNKAYRGAKAADTANGDPGHLGEFILENGQWWECQTGNDWLCFRDSNTPIVMASSSYPTAKWTRQVTFPVKNLARTSSNAAAKPVFPGGAVPNVTVVTDNGAGATGGGLVWICRTPGANNNSDGNTNAGGVGPDGSTNNRALRVMRPTDSGFDPLRILSRLKAAIIGSPVGNDNHYCLCTATVQSDAGKDTTLVVKGMQLFGNYMLDATYLNGAVKPIYTNCIFDPASSQAAYDTVETALTGTGLDGSPNYNSNPLQALFAAQGYVKINPGVTGRNGALYAIIEGQYRKLGLDVTEYLQVPQPDPHPNPYGCDVYAEGYVEDVAKILLNVATFTRTIA